jgi:hypothetical protein
MLKKKLDFLLIQALCSMQRVSKEFCIGLIHKVRLNFKNFYIPTTECPSFFNQSISVRTSIYFLIQHSAIGFLTDLQSIHFSVRICFLNIIKEFCFLNRALQYSYTILTK